MPGCDAGSVTGSDVVLAGAAYDVPAAGGAYGAAAAGAPVAATGAAVVGSVFWCVARTGPGLRAHDDNR